MSLIRIGFIGLGTSVDALSPGAWGSLAHLPSILASPRYRITAICNSSVSSAQASIDFHKLSSETKAYGSPRDLASDPDVDLIVCSVRLSKHYDLVKPALLAGKDVFVEWSLAATTAQAEELAEIAKSKKVNTFVGCQARADPLVIKIKEMIENKVIGDVLSSVVTGCFAGLPNPWPASAAYYQDLDSGGNAFYIYHGHFLDSFTHILGSFAKLSSILEVEASTVTLVDASGNIVEEKHPKTTPDEVFVQGILKSGAVVSTNYRQIPAKTTVTRTGIRWIITGTQGEIELTTPELQWQMGFPGVTLKMRIGDGEVMDIGFEPLDEPAYISCVPVPGRNTARLNVGHIYDAFARDDLGLYPDFEQALATHRLLDSILERQI